MSYRFSFLHALGVLLLIYHMSWCVPTLATWRRVHAATSTMHRSSRLPCILPACMHFLGCVFYLFFFSSQFFLKKVFGEFFFFPWACWPRVLNEFIGVMLAHPSYLNVCVTVWSGLVIFILLCSVLSLFVAPLFSVLSIEKSVVYHETVNSACIP